MTRPNRSLCALLTVVWLMPCSAAGSLPAPPATRTVPTQELSLSIRDDRIDAEFRRVALGAVAETLQNRGAARVAFFDPGLADEPVSLSIRSGSLEDAIRFILRGFSYAMARSGAGLDVVVLSTPPWRDDNSDIPRPSCGNASSGAAPVGEPTDPRGPQTLDDFRPYDAFDAGCSDGSAGLGAPVAEEEKRMQEHAIQRALDVLESPYSNLYADAIEQLGMYRDERASAALIKLATQTPPRPERYLATEALARIAEQSEFRDMSAVMALEHLAAEGDAEIRRTAGPVVEQLHRVDARVGPTTEAVQQ